MQTLPEKYHEIISSAIDEKGVFPHQMLGEDDNGKLTMFAVAINNPKQAMEYIFNIFNGNTKDVPKQKQLIYTLDRWCEKGQGTTLKDCLAGAFYNGRFWLPFVIEYQNEPRIVKPINWNNSFWNEKIREELKSWQEVFGS